MILGIETSCDDTCAAVVDGAGVIHANVISSQGVHDRYGGVVPEVAARHHLELLNDVVDEALRTAGTDFDRIDLVAVTQGPGLVGALLVGLAGAKAIAAVRGLPLVPVDHLHGHIAANFLQTDAPPLEPPFVCLVASGGHTFVARVDDHASYAVLGATLDDAAGEALDKGARTLGLPFPGGPAIERVAADGDPDAFAFPIAAGVAGTDFSFAGLKTALLYAVRDLGEDAASRRADLAASYQRAVVEALVLRVQRAVDATGIARVAIGGGVAANGPLRARLAGLGLDHLHVPPRELCTDNAAMIASAARWLAPDPGFLALDAYASGDLRAGDVHTGSPTSRGAVGRV